jgi:hypothetical protein
VEHDVCNNVHLQMRFFSWVYLGHRILGFWHGGAGEWAEFEFARPYF